MNRTLLNVVEDWAIGSIRLLCSVLVILFLTAADTFLAGRNLLPVRPIVLFGLLGVLLAAACGIALLCHPGRLRTVMKALLEDWSLLLASLAFLAFVVLAGALLPQAVWIDGGTYVFLPLFSILAFLIGAGSVLLWNTRGWETATLYGALATSTFSIIVDLVSPGAFSTLVQRAAGVAENANYSAYIILLLVSALLDWGNTSKRGLTVLGFGGIAVLATLSRSGTLLWLMLFMAYLAYGFFRLPDAAAVIRRFVLVACVVIIGVGLAAVMVGQSEQFQTASATQRLASFSGQGTFVSSDDERLVAIRRFTTEVEARPWFGYGTGYSYGQRVGPHNMYLSQWLSQGVFGLIIYMAVLGTAAYGFFRKQNTAGVMCCLIVAVVGLFSHNVLEQKPFFIAIGLLVGRSLLAGLRNEPDASSLIRVTPEAAR